MKYYVKTLNGILTNDLGEILTFKSDDDARHCIINHCDLSDKKLEILSVPHGWQVVEA